MYYLDFLDLAKQKYKHLNIDKYKSLIEQERNAYIQKNNENVLLQIWTCLEIIASIDNYHNAFVFLKDRRYKKGWSELAKAEITIRNIIRNTPNYRDYLVVTFLDKYIKK
jgi:hypothetical protein